MKQPRAPASGWRATSNGLGLAGNERLYVMGAVQVAAAGAALARRGARYRNGIQQITNGVHIGGPAPFFAGCGRSGDTGAIVRSASGDDEDLARSAAARRGCDRLLDLRSAASLPAQVPAGSAPGHARAARITRSGSPRRPASTGTSSVAIRANRDLSLSVKSGARAELHTDSTPWPVSARSSTASPAGS
jgi:hypothetical protein